jgi:hypothetical protein
MKNFTWIFCLVVSFSFAQNAAEKDAKKVIETFFEAFHKGDTVLLKSTLYDKVTLQTVYKNKEGKDIFVDEGGPEKLIKAIGTRADDQKWEERLLDYVVKVDGNMANVWTPYEFWFNGSFSHCGVNSFQLFHDNGTWKIIYLIDTRRRSDCEVGN